MCKTSEMPLQETHACFFLHIWGSFVRKYIVQRVKGRGLRINCKTTMEKKKTSAKGYDRQGAEKSQP